LYLHSAGMVVSLHSAGMDVSLHSAGMVVSLHSAGMHYKFIAAKAEGGKQINNQLGVGSLFASSSLALGQELSAASINSFGLQMHGHSSYV